MDKPKKLDYKRFCRYMRKSISKEYYNLSKEQKTIHTYEDIAAARYQEYLDIGAEMLELN